MTESLTSKVSVNVTGSLAGSPLLGSTAHQLAQLYAQSFANGSGVNQADQIYSTQLTITASGSTTLNFNTGLNDALGNAIALTGLKALIVAPHASNTNDVIVGNAGSNVILHDFFTNSVPDDSSTVTIKPGGLFVVTNPTANGYVVSSSNCNLKLANSSSGSSVVVDIIVIGK